MGMQNEEWRMKIGKRKIGRLGGWKYLSAF
jgi:hypothetical protein